VRAVQIGIGIVCAGFVIAAVVVMSLFQWPSAQRLIVANNFKDARCTVEFPDGTGLKFSVREQSRYEKTLRAPKTGFTLIRCSTASGFIETPGHFHLINGGRAEVEFTQWGTVDVRYVQPSKAPAKP